MFAIKIKLNLLNTYELKINTVLTYIFTSFRLILDAIILSNLVLRHSGANGYLTFFLIKICVNY